MTQKPWSRRQTSCRQSSQVAASISGHDLKLTRLGRDLKVMSQHEFSCHDPGLLSPNLSQVATPKRMSRHQLFQSRSRRQNDVATSPCLAQVARALPRSSARAGAVVRATAHALRTCCPPVTTSKPGRDPVLEIGSSHSSFLPCKKKFIYLFFKTSSSFPATPRMQ